MTVRKQLLELLSREPRTASSVARELGLDRGDVEEHLRHLIRTARTAGHRVVVDPARCRTCGFVFEESRLTRPGKCPSCRGTRVFEPRLSIEQA